MARIDNGQPVDPNRDPDYRSPTAWRQMKDVAQRIRLWLPELLGTLEKLDGCPRYWLAAAVHALVAADRDERQRMLVEYKRWHQARTMGLEKRDAGPATELACPHCKAILDSEASYWQHRREHAREFAQPSVGRFGLVSVEIVDGEAWFVVQGKEPPTANGQAKDIGVCFEERKIILHPHADPRKIPAMIDAARDFIQHAPRPQRRDAGDEWKEPNPEDNHD